MIRRRLLLPLILALAGPAAAVAQPAPAVPAQPVAHDRALEVLNAERAFAAMAQREGQWTAFRAFAAPDALLFAPQPVNAHDLLRDRADPPRAVDWQPQRVIISCDGEMGATTGATQWPDGRFGYFTTIWRRQPDGGWRWIADHGDFLAHALPAVDVPAIEIAECPGAIGPEPQGAAQPGAARGGAPDQSLLWDWVATGGSSGLRVTIWIGPRYAATILPGTSAR